MAAGPARGGEGVVSLLSALADLVAGVYLHPVRTFREVASNAPVGRALFLYLLVSAAGALMAVLTTPRLAPHQQLAAVSGGLGSAVAVLFLAWALAKLFVYSGLLHLIAEFFGGRGSAREVFTVYGLASLPTLILIPWHLLVTWLPGYLRVGLTVPVALGIFVWTVVLLILGVREVHGLTTARAALVVLVPPAVLALGVLVTAAGLLAGVGAHLWVP